MLMKENFNSIIAWCIVNPYKNLKNAKKIEKKWGNNIIDCSSSIQWTSKLGEYIVKIELENKGCRVIKPRKINKYMPDLETENFIYEVKTRNWNTKGTAGEKVFGVPYKYSDIPRLYSKPLRIVCVAYQEYELTYGNSNVFGGSMSEEKKELLKYWKERNIEFIPFSKIIDDK